VAVTSFSEECRAPCDRPVERADDRFHVGGSGVTMSPEFTLLDHAKDGRVDVTVKAGSAGGAALGTFLTTIGFAGLITGGTLAVIGAVGSSSSSVRESFLLSGLITAGVGAVLTAIGFPVLLGNRTRLIFGDGATL
jgi:hypothetical protein